MIFGCFFIYGMPSDFDANQATNFQTDFESSHKNHGSIENKQKCPETSFTSIKTLLKIIKCFVHIKL